SLISPIPRTPTLNAFIDVTPLVTVGDSGEAAGYSDSCDNTHRCLDPKGKPPPCRAKSFPSRAIESGLATHGGSAWTVRVTFSQEMTPPASPHRRHDKLCLGSRAGRPACRDGLEPGVEAHTLRPVHVVVA